MPRNRNPLAKAQALGADLKDPKRYAGRAEPATPGKIGGPSEWLSTAQRLAWAEFRSELPWLTESDRAILEIASVLRARLISGEQFGVPTMAQLRLCLNALGGTPTTRSYVRATDDNEPDPADEFLN